MTWNDFVSNNFLMKLIAAIAELVVGFMLGPALKRWIMRLHNKRGVDEGVLTFTGSMVSILVRVLAVIVALGQLGADVTAIVGIFSAMGLGISLALKESMANVAGGVQILVTKPFKVGDYIACGQQEGTVMEIEIMFTTLKTVNNQMVVVPNSSLVSTMLINYTAYPTRRMVIAVPVSSAGDYQDFRAQLQKMMEDNPNVLQDPKPKTVIGDFNAEGNGITISAVCYMNNNVFWDEKYMFNQKIQQLRAQMKLDPAVNVVRVVSQ